MFACMWIRMKLEILHVPILSFLPVVGCTGRNVTEFLALMYSKADPGPALAPSCLIFGVVVVVF